MYSSVPETKPSAITTAQVIMWIQAGFGLVAVCLLASISSQVEQAGLGEGVLGVMLVAVLVIAVVNAVCAVGVGRGSNAARITAIVLQCLNVAGGGVGLLTGGAGGGGGTMCGTVVGLALAVTVIVSLAQEDARLWCRRPAG